MLACPGHCKCQSSVLEGFDDFAVFPWGEVVTGISSVLGIGGSLAVGKTQEKLVKRQIKEQRRAEKEAFAEAQRERTFQEQLVQRQLEAQREQQAESFEREQTAAAKRREFWTLMAIGGGAVLISGLFIYGAVRNRKK